MNWNVTAYSNNIWLKRTRWLSGRLYTGGQYLAVLDGYGETTEALEHCQFQLSSHAARARACTAESDMLDLFAALDAVTKYCIDGVRLSVAFVFDCGQVTLGSLGDTSAIFGRRTDVGMMEVSFNSLHVPSLNKEERDRLLLVGIECSSLFVRSYPGDVTTVTGFLGDWPLAEVATRIPEVRTIEDVEPGDVVLLGTSNLYDMKHHIFSPYWHRLFASRASGEKVLRVLRHVLAQSCDDASVALGYCVPG